MSTKQVIVIRKDLNMRKGKMVAQGAHASMAVFFDMMHECEKSGDYTIFSDNISKAMREWMNGSFTKVCVSVGSEAELLAIHQCALRHGIVSSLIQDAGRTEFGGVPTYTAVAIGPDEAIVIDQVTGATGPYGKLKLL